MDEQQQQRREKLEAYLQGTLTSQEQTEVHALIQHDKLWQQDFHLLKQDQAGIRWSKLQELKQNLEHQEKELPKGKNENNSSSVGDLSTLSTPIDDTTPLLKDVTTSMTPTEDIHDIDDVTREGIRYHALEQVRQELEEEEKKFSSGQGLKENDKLKRIRPWVKWMGVAAAVLILVYSSWLYFEPPTLLEQFEAKGYVKPEMKHLYRGPAEDSIQMLIQKAYGAYAMGDYKLAIKYFEKVPPQIDSNYNNYYLYTLLKLNKVNKIKQFLNQDNN